MTAKKTSDFDEYAGTVPRKSNRDRAEDRTRFQISEGVAILSNPPIWVLRDNLENVDYCFGSYATAYSAYEMIRDGHASAEYLYGRPSSIDAYFRKLDTLQNIPDAD